MSFKYNFAFIEDQNAKKCEKKEQGDFLYSGKKPRIGQRTETSIVDINEQWFMMSGEITEIYQEPSKAEQNNPVAIDEPYAFGALQGQRVVGISELNHDFIDKQGTLPVKAGEKYRIVYKFNDNLVSMWEVVTLEKI